MKWRIEDIHFLAELALPRPAGLRLRMWPFRQGNADRIRGSEKEKLINGHNPGRIGVTWSSPGGKGSIRAWFIAVSQLTMLWELLSSQEDSHNYRFDIKEMLELKTRRLDVLLSSVCYCKSAHCDHDEFGMMATGHNHNLGIVSHAVMMAMQLKINVTHWEASYIRLPSPSM